MEMMPKGCLQVVFGSFSGFEPPLVAATVWNAWSANPEPRRESVRKGLRREERRLIKIQAIQGNMTSNRYWKMPGLDLKGFEMRDIMHCYASKNRV